MVCASAIQALAGSPQNGWHRAERIVEWMRRPGSAAQPDAFVYSGLISLLGAAGEWERAHAAFASMEGAGCRPNVYVFSAILSVLATARQPDLARAVFESMPARGVQPSQASAARAASPAACRVLPLFTCCLSLGIRVNLLPFSPPSGPSRFWWGLCCRPTSGQAAGATQSRFCARPSCSTACPPTSTCTTLASRRRGRRGSGGRRRTCSAKWRSGECLMVSLEEREERGLGEIGGAHV